MKIGDKVKFLSETGGGRISGFRPGNIVLVEDEDGFEIPTPMTDVVVMGSGDDYKTANMVKAKIEQHENAKTDHRSVKAKLAVADEEPFEDEPEVDIADKEITFKKPVEERKGGNQLNCYLAFVPVDPKNFSTTNFECYIINDSNYYFKYVCTMPDGVTWKLWQDGELEPNTKEFFAEFRHEDLNNLDRIVVQLLPFKREKNFVMKSAVEARLRMEPVKFYKLHAFEENDFFEQPALLYPIVENDRVARPLDIDAKKLKQEMYRKDEDQSKQEAKPAKVQNTYVRRYDNGKQGNPFVQKHNGKDEILVIDLHADELLDTTAGMSATDILNYQLGKFRETLELHKNEKGKRIVFIHGKGEGVLRHAIVNELHYRYKRFTYQDASFQEYGYGATQVTIK